VDLCISDNHYEYNFIFPYHDLTPNREDAYCCGGGSGLVALSEASDIRMMAGKAKAEQVKHSGAQVVVAACENCRLQLGDLSGHYGSGYWCNSPD
jgi:Fe-S oxidoreductase